MASPVKTPCNHVFCRECITEWLNQPSKASCAMCRKQLFQRNLPMQPDPDRHARVVRALRASGLLGVNIPAGALSNAAAFTVVNTFNGRIEYTRAGIQRATGAAVTALAFRDLISTTGVVSVDARLGSGLIVMANMLRALAADSGNDEPAVRARVDAYVLNMWGTIERVGARKMDGRQLAEVLKAGFNRDFPGVVRNGVPHMRENQAVVDELQLFLAYIVNVARRLAPGAENEAVGDDLTEVLFLADGRRRGAISL